jgi:hypothetical protein
MPIQRCRGLVHSSVRGYKEMSRALVRWTVLSRNSVIRNRHPKRPPPWMHPFATANAHCLPARWSMTSICATPAACLLTKSRLNSVTGKRNIPSCSL